MHWTQVVGAIAVLNIVLVVVGGGLALATNGLLTGQSALAAMVVLALVAVAVAAVALVGRNSASHTYNPDAYW